MEMNNLKTIDLTIHNIWTFDTTCTHTVGYISHAVIPFYTLAHQLYEILWSPWKK